ncbi:MAG: hypothetical protein F9K29_08080 [Hyphomicrobiaceae bacterium]|nr:MAG: hypothetical protein F9K29_08080 [Hyphomicrobiaceae bacterium]
MSKPKKGRPPKAGKAMLVPITIRLPAQMNEEIEAIVMEKALEGADKSTVMRELLAIGLRERAKQKA